MPKRCVSGLCNNTYEDVTVLTDTWPKDSQIARMWDRFVKLDRANWKHGDPAYVLCGVHFRQPNDFLSYGQWTHKFSFHSRPTQGKCPRIDLDQTSSSNH